MKKNAASIDEASSEILTRTALKKIEKRKSQIPGISMSVKDVFGNEDQIIGVVEYTHGGIILKNNVSVWKFPDGNGLHKLKCRCSPSMDLPCIHTIAFIQRIAMRDDLG